MKIDSVHSPYAFLKTIILQNVCLKPDHTDAVSEIRKRDGVAGHPEIELALVEFSGESSQPRNLTSAAFLFINTLLHIGESRARQNAGLITFSRTMMFLWRDNTKEAY